MTTAVQNAPENRVEGTTSVEFGAENLKANAKAYRAHNKIVNAAAAYDSPDDAIKCLRETVKILEKQVEDGGGYTPSLDLDFGSDNAAQIAEALLGRRTSLGSTRKAMAKHGQE